MVVDEGMWDRVLPFMPVFPAAQVMRARARYVDTAAVAGISFVTAYRQDASPFINNEFLYTFQGLSTDGTYYVSAIFRLMTDLFPSELPADFDYEAFAASLMDYFTDSTALLNDATPEAFSPSLTTVDAVIQSFAFGG
jgi:hypothetical protein